jgi:hypothetical protein
LSEFFTVHREALPEEDSPARLWRCSYWITHGYWAGWEFAEPANQHRRTALQHKRHDVAAPEQQHYGHLFAYRAALG